MSVSPIDEDIKQFIYSYVDSVEQLDVLFLLKDQANRAVTAHEISDKLRSSATSVAIRLESLHRMKLLEKTEMTFQYKPQSEELNDLVQRLADTYKIRRHQILTLIFSPMKRARNFADAFIISGGTKKVEDSNG